MNERKPAENYNKLKLKNTHTFCYTITGKYVGFFAKFWSN